MTLDEHFEWFENCPEFRLNSYSLLAFAERNYPEELTMTPAQQHAWIAYYTTLRDDPDAEPEERQRAIDMLGKAEYMRIGSDDDLA